MVYPAIVLSVAAIVVAIIMTFVMPVFVGLFESLKIPLPIVTQIIIGLSNFVRNFWYLIVAVIIGGVFAYRQALKSENFRLWQDGVFLKVPIFGALYNKIIITRFSRTFASLSRSGVPILQGLAIVSRATGSLQAAKVLNEARISLTEGNSLSEPMEKSGLFPPMVISLTKIGEDTGSLDAMLDKVAEFYGAEVDDMVARMQTILDPILIVILGIVIGTLAVGLLLPMFEIVTKVGNL
jgi:type IV pilus assembly protein PilC